MKIKAIHAENSAHALAAKDSGSSHANLVEQHARFINQPEQMDALVSSANKVWGTQSTQFTFAGMHIRFQGINDEQARCLHERYRNEPSNQNQQDEHSITVYRVDSDFFRRFDVRGWDYQLSVSYQSEDIWVSGIQFVARICRKAPMDVCIWTDVAGGRTFLNPAENSLRVLSAYLLLAAGGVMLHSAAISFDQRAVIFFGPSGTGKTTVSRFCDELGHQVLSDELNAILPADGPWSLQPLPFAGDFGSTHVAQRPLEIRRIFRLVQSPDSKAIAMSQVRAVASMLACCPYVNADPYVQQRCIDNLNQIVLYHGVERLEFRKDTSFLKALEA